MKQYVIVPRTADVGVTAYGNSTRSLFENAAKGMMSLLGKPNKAGDIVARTVHVKGYDNETLLINWLNELLYLVTVKTFLSITFSINEIKSGHLKAMVQGIKIPSGFTLLREIKAATFHDLAIRKDSRGFRVTVVFDL